MVTLDGYTAIKSIIAPSDGTSGPTLKLIGVVIHTKDAYQLKSRDWTIEFIIQDEFQGALIGGSSSVCCRVFTKEKSQLPTINAVGDLIIIHGVRAQQFGGKLVVGCGSNQSSGFVTFKAKNVPMIEYSTPYSFGGNENLLSTLSYMADEANKAEQMAIIHLKAAALPFMAQIRNFATAKAPKPPSKDRKSLIQDLEFGKYYDILGEVVKFFSPDSMTMDLYITDYTTNKALFLYEDPEDSDSLIFATQRKWPGPFGQMTLQVRLWEPHNSFARENIREGDIVLLRNIHTKLSNANKLEGALHQDQRFPDKILITKVKYQDQMEELNRRKEAYENQRESDNIARMNANQAKKPSAKASAKKKEEKKEKERQKKEKERKALEEQAEEDAVTRAGVNPHIRAAYPEIRFSTINEILNNPARKIKDAKGNELVLPFINTRYRARLRVVDFSPSRLEEFCRSMLDPTWNRNLRESDSKDVRRDDRWQWGFTLLVEDAHIPTGTAAARYPLFVCNEGAQHLLGMDAFDPYVDRNALSLKQLEAKFFILWGNLLELKEELTPKGVQFPLPSNDPRLKNMPFECCIWEYGDKIKPTPAWPLGYQRMLKLMHTTIKN